MEDWQGCLSPECQTALLMARENVGRRGGSVITAEDFLLALLDAIPAIPPFLQRQSIDLDELVRTIQGEQPIVTEVVGDGDLSSQLIYWIASARESAEVPWLDWPVLLKALTSQCERLQDKAYVAVLELVTYWPSAHDVPVPTSDARFVAPVSIAEPEWLALAEDVAVALAANPEALIWVRGPRGAGKSAWLHSLLSTPGLAWVQVDPRRESEVLACDQPVLPSGDSSSEHWPALVLDNVSPADLLTLIAEPLGLIRDLVSGWSGPILLIGRDSMTDSSGVVRLGQLLGREPEVLELPPVSVRQRRAVLTAHQPAIEKRWNIQVSQAALEYAASRQSSCVSTPGGMLQWVRRAAARLDLFASRGSVSAAALEGEKEVWHRQSLVALARGEDCHLAEQKAEVLMIEQAAADVLWHERKRAGTLRRLLVDDLREELERWVAARPGPVHYVRHCEQLQGESLGAGSGNLHS
ncbi:MAG TPA: hypothetical protein DCX68_02120 [Marinobacter hydrocarbonoclasticus]|jgi:diadenosine tetraphosphatase ApaH/serine/threonine PP2A family protein phosphatase|uniref:Uncharacterized protein n=2 Tax=Marinobacter TaxID=2742 RepID=A0A350RSR9_MARNT|nr:MULTISPECIES: hypothetical protein [Marinobacter]MAC23838.1 hypothetical protein [Marinobacter sp.]HAC27790.1 hypothetical protein [Marinobacter nauticus]HAX08837.1 hypothetical protein [Marinobacter nauticus]HCR45536.1 hypothetical protein [Marinobacter nauticus]|tara:strand:+ start:613 stop:2016 length:1404 start_codon:yes stop_codon:yes gene_type:complete